MNDSLYWRRVLLIGLALAAVAVVAWFCLLSTSVGVERRFIATVWAASALALGFATRRVWFSVFGATAFFGLMWAASALKFKYLEVPAIAPDLYYFFTLDTLKVIASYPLLALSSLGLLVGIPLLVWLVWCADPPADFSHHSQLRRRWARRVGLVFALLVLAASLTPQGAFAEVYGKPMWIAVNDKSFIVDFIVSFYDTRIHVPQAHGALDPSLRWTVEAPVSLIGGPQRAGDDHMNIPRQPQPDIVSVLEESTFDPMILSACHGNPLCRRAMFTPDSRTLAHGLLGVHNFGGGTWVSEFALITGLAHTLFGNAGLYAPYNLAPLVQFSIAKSLKAQGYRVVGLYPTNAEFLNGSNAYRAYGFDALYDGVDLGLAWHARDEQVFDLFWKLYQQEKLEHPGQPLFFMVLTLHQHGPHMNALRTLPAPYNKPLFAHRLAGQKGLDDWLNLNLGNYLQRNAESDSAMRMLEARLLDRDVPTLLLHFGDHQPSFDGAMMVLDKTLPASWGGYPQWATYYMLKSNIADAPHFRYPMLDIVYLGGLLLQAGGVPENRYYAANRLLRERCAGRYEECADPQLLPSYHDYIFRQIKMLGE